jgi:hypothetical protein
MTQDELKRLVEYRNGTLYWTNPTSNRVKIGDEVGSVCANGYRGCRINGQAWYVHRLVYFYHHGKIPKVVDHIDRNRLNNAVENLREVTQQPNNFNCSGTKGYIKNKDKFIAKITLNGKQYRIGTYISAEEATAAYSKVKPVLHTFLSSYPSEDTIKSKIKEVRPKTHANNTSGVVGVRKRHNGRWQATATENGKRISLGHFASAEEASGARVKYLKKIGI